MAIELNDLVMARTMSADSTAFPAYEEQLEALNNGSIVHAFEAYRLVRVSGADAQSFLQGQLSNDIRDVDQQHAQYSSYSSAKGRVIASFLIWKAADDYYLLMMADIAEAVCKRLSMFIMRSKVTLAVCNEVLLLGTHGVEAEQWLATQLGALPEAPLAVMQTTTSLSLRLPGGALLLAADEQVFRKMLSAMPSSLRKIDAEAWSLLDIKAGIAWVAQASQALFVAQMLNMDLISAVSFTKGCFPGQEIIARTRYLGKIKKRLYRILISGIARDGDELYSPGMEEQAIGKIVNIARVEGEQCQALAVIQAVCWSKGIFLDKNFENKINKLSLPYAGIDE